jgi:pheromone shutdown protein TraB
MFIIDNELCHVMCVEMDKKKILAMINNTEKLKNNLKNLVKTS